MRMLLAFAGSRGDAQPGILVARELLDRGHRVTLAVSPNLVGFAAECGVPAVGFGLDTGELLRRQLAARTGRGGHPAAWVSALRRLNQQGFAEAAEDLLELAAGHDVVVGGMANEELGDAVAAHLGVPFAAVHFFPIQPNRSVPVVPNRFGALLPGALNRRAVSAVVRARAWAMAPPLAELARVAPESEQRAQRIAIQAYDERIFPGLAQEWGPRSPFTGFVVPRPEDLMAVSDMALAQWIHAGSAPVYAGFGSMPVGDTGALVTLLRAASRSIGRRLLFVSGWSRATPTLAEDVAIVPAVNHAEVLPHCVAAVHHGGAGTTAAAVRAGVPSVVCSFLADQHYWGRQLSSLGLGTTARFARLSLPRLERLLTRATSDAVRARALAFSDGFRDDGAQCAADAIEALAAGHVLRTRSRTVVFAPTEGSRP
ncbi:glycosyltransferase [Nocardia sp. NPDC050406]|uniref:glycosyltransferase n=1 Tax=Nocardia sp. NPDC050406 TaxID=3364318 RepID=UPI003796FEED